MNRRTGRVLFTCVSALLAATSVAQQPPPDLTFRTGTRLVQVEVAVRNQPVRPPGLRASLKYIFDSGPPFGPPGTRVAGLTKSDFTLLDEGRPQPVAIFSTEPLNDLKSIPLRPGDVSNRTDEHGQPLNGATAVLLDQLNTPWELTEYARQGMIELLRSLGETNTRIALYSLGRDLHVLHDFSDDPQRLREIAAQLDQPHGRLPADYKGALRDFGDMMSFIGPEVAADVHGRITVKAVSNIIEHLSGVPGRKNLIWLAQISRLPPRVAAMLQRANIVLYPVMVRCYPSAPCGFAMLETDDATREQNTASGGRGFFDARDLTFATQAAQEDSHNSYVLGYYPTEDMLDGRFHKITVRLREKGLETHYRSGYFATKAAVAPPPPKLANLFDDPLESTRIGLAAQAAPDARRPGRYDLRVTVDLHDIHLDRKDGRFTGAFELAAPIPSSKDTFTTGTVSINLTDADLAAALENGFTCVFGGIQADSGEIRLVVRDRATGIAGSLRVPVRE